eukprot:81641-Chlamydomonas_euryale.AAC.16
MAQGAKRHVLDASIVFHKAVCDPWMCTALYRVDVTFDMVLSFKPFPQPVPLSVGAGHCGACLAFAFQKHAQNTQHMHCAPMPQTRGVL